MRYALVSIGHICGVGVPLVYVERDVSYILLNFAQASSCALYLQIVPKQEQCVLQTTMKALINYHNAWVPHNFLYDLLLSYTEV